MRDEHFGSYEGLKISKVRAAPNRLNEGVFQPPTHRHMFSHSCTQTLTKEGISLYCYPLAKLKQNSTSVQNSETLDEKGILAGVICITVCKCRGNRISIEEGLANREFAIQIGCWTAHSLQQHRYAYRRGLFAT